MEKVDTLIIDKTGTLTEGKPAVTAIAPGAGFDEADAAAAGRQRRASKRAPARCRDRAGGQGTGPDACRVSRDFDSPTGKGVFGTVEGKRSRSATPSSSPGSASTSRALAARSGSAARRWRDRHLHGGRRPGRRRHRHRRSGQGNDGGCARRLKAEGIRIVMLTGDNRTTAKAVARQLGIDEVAGRSVARSEKRGRRTLRPQGEVVAMAGDGVNDAPALAAADVGIAMGTGTDVAMESAGITLLKGDLTGIVRARRLSQAVMSNIRQNLFFAFIYNALGCRSRPACSTRGSACCSRRSLPPPRWRCLRSA